MAEIQEDYAGLAILGDYIRSMCGDDNPVMVAGKLDLAAILPDGGALSLCNITAFTISTYASAGRRKSIWHDICTY